MRYNLVRHGHHLLGVTGMFRGRAFLLGDQPQLGCSWRTAKIKALKTLSTADQGKALQSDMVGLTRYSLSISFKLTDLKERHEVVFAVAWSSRRAGHRAQFGGWHYQREGVIHNKNITKTTIINGFKKMSFIH